MKKHYIPIIIIIIFIILTCSINKHIKIEDALEIAIDVFPEKEFGMIKNYYIKTAYVPEINAWMFGFHEQTFKNGKLYVVLNTEHTYVVNRNGNYKLLGPYGENFLDNKYLIYKKSEYFNSVDKQVLKMAMIQFSKQHYSKLVSCLFSIEKVEIDGFYSVIFYDLKNRVSNKKIVELKINPKTNEIIEMPIAGSIDVD